MGPCNSVCPKQRNSTKPVIDKSYNKQTIPPPQTVEKKINTKAIIENANNTLIIRSISEINGDAIKIEKCTDSTIIIMDYSAQVSINECKNCTFFIAPCKGSIYLNKSDNIKIICASSQFRCRDVNNSKISLFSSSKPAIESVKNLFISCFCFMYTELPDVFAKADLNIWDNCWSEYVNFSKNSGDLGNMINYFEVKSDEEFLEEYNRALKDQDISLDQYFPVPYTTGMSYKINKDDNHMLVLFKEAYIDNLKLTDLVKIELLNDLSIKLMKTCTLEKCCSVLNDIDNALKKYKKLKKSEFLGSDVNLSNPNGANGGVNLNLNRDSNNAVNNNNNNNFIALWFVTDDYNFETYMSLLDDQLENFVCFVKNDFEEISGDQGNENGESNRGNPNDPALNGNKILKDFIKMLFKDYDIY
jgi:hypothetical protein